MIRKELKFEIGKCALVTSVLTRDWQLPNCSLKIWVVNIESCASTKSCWKAVLERVKIS